MMMLEPMSTSNSRGTRVIRPEGVTSETSDHKRGMYVLCDSEIKGGSYRETDVDSVQGRIFSEPKRSCHKTGCLERE